MSPSSAKRDANDAEPKILGGHTLYAGAIFNPSLAAVSALMGWRTRRGVDGLRRSLVQKWRDYRFHVDTRRYEFDLRHPRLRWMPLLIAFTFVATTATGIVLNTASVSPGINHYLLGLVAVSCGMVAVEVMAGLIGRKLWREDRDLRYIGVVVGFASLPVWGSIEATCVSYLIPDFSRSGVCRASPGLSWVAVAWLIAIPLLLALVDFRWFLASRAKGSAN